ncbi:hypothetical protein [Zobellia sp. B3R18]|uniref:hypothetical protein n=1 Tax=Zobellia sp. B3R18 TaxID=2841568 RepID=UPI001C07B3A9|nr:hypothetical protein [Zobellia sp. B3R18]MBU2974394.1 hypothetical protein [Zobellia sp. B3R18]
MRNLTILCFLFLLTACNWSVSKEEKTQELVNKEILSIDWEDVDQYPLFADCDEIASKQEQKQCFMATLLEHFSKTLEESDFVVEEAVKDTIFVDFLMEASGAISLLHIDKGNITEDQLPGFDQQIGKSLNSLPKIEPALKRGIPVRAKFRIPIVLQ